MTNARLFLYYHGIYLLLLPFVFSHNTKVNNSNTTYIDFYDEDGRHFKIDLTVPKEVVLNQTHRKLFKPAEFWLYTNMEPNKPKILLVAESLKIQPTIFVTHGWMGSATSNSTQLIKNGYLDTSNVNVIIINWEEGAGYFDYVLSAKAVSEVATQVNTFVTDLVKKFKMKDKYLHFIGHSLGAHLMGLAAKQLQKKGIHIARVTGLDPARPYFEYPHILDGIQKEDADFVDIIHTNAGFLGIVDHVGHVDFYPNGGDTQYTCCKSIYTPICEHCCCFLYYANSLRGTKYEAAKCDSYKSYISGKCRGNEKVLMGEQVVTSARGVFYLTI